MDVAAASLWGASLCCGLGIALLVGSLAIDPLPARMASRLPGVPALYTGAISAIAVGVTAQAGHIVVATALSGITTGALGIVVMTLRAGKRRGRDDDGGGGPGGGGSPPRDDSGPSGGLAVDWEAFESAFRAHCERDSSLV